MTVSGGVSAVAAGDLNGDGLPDFVVSGTGVFWPILNNPGHHFSVPGGPLNYYLTGLGSGTGSIATGDFNQDGRVDVLMLNYGGIAVVYGNGDGTFSSEQDFKRSYNIRFQAAKAPDRPTL